MKKFLASRAKMSSLKVSGLSFFRAQTNRVLTTKTRELQVFRAKMTVYSHSSESENLEFHVSKDLRSYGTHRTSTHEKILASLGKDKPY